MSLNCTAMVVANGSVLTGRLQNNAVKLFQFTVTTAAQFCSAVNKLCKHTEGEKEKSATPKQILSARQQTVQVKYKNNGCQMKRFKKNIIKITFFSRESCPENDDCILHLM